MTCCLTATSHYLNQCWFTIKWALRTHFNEMLSKNMKLFIAENAFGNVVCKNARFHLLTHWCQVMHIASSNLTIIGSDNGLSPGWHQAIIWTNAGILLIWTLGKNFSDIVSKIHTFSLKKMLLKMLSTKCQFSESHSSEFALQLRECKSYFSLFEWKQKLNLMSGVHDKVYICLFGTETFSITSLAETLEHLLWHLYCSTGESWFWHWGTVLLWHWDIYDTEHPLL